MKKFKLILLSILLSDICFGQQQPSSSSWIGATLMQNFDGNGAESLIGGGNVRISTAKNLTGSFRLNVVGNISSISKATNTENIKSNLVRIGQSAQGLSVGFEPEYIFIEDVRDIKLFNIYSHLAYKVNDFQKINNTNENVVLSQFRSTVGFAIEAIEFNEDDYISLSVEGIRTGFSPKDYEKIFGTNKSSIYSLEIIGIIPLFWKMGLLVGQNFTKGTKGVFSAGIVVKN